jgi:hypothetical protein
MSLPAIALLREDRPPDSELLDQIKPAAMGFLKTQGPLNHTISPTKKIKKKSLVGGWAPEQWQYNMFIIELWGWWSVIGEDAFEGREGERGGMG